MNNLFSIITAEGEDGNLYGYSPELDEYMIINDFKEVDITEVPDEILQIFREEGLIE